MQLQNQRQDGLDALAIGKMICEIGYSNPDTVNLIENWVPECLFETFQPPNLTIFFEWNFYLESAIDFTSVVSLLIQAIPKYGSGIDIDFRTSHFI